MKKKISILSGVLVLVIALGIGMYHSDASQAEPKLNLKEVKSLVLSQFPGEITELELEKEDNRAVYEIEIENEEMEYELKVDANSGEILKLKEKRIASKEKVKEEQEDTTEKIKLEEDKSSQEKNTASSNTEQTKIDAKDVKQEVKQPKQEAKQQPKQQAQPKQEVKQQPKQQPKQEVKQQKKQEKKRTVISRERAIEIALAEFPGEVDDVELDEEDGRLIYEVEIENGDREAEIEIDAMTGKIIVIDIDD